VLRTEGAFATASGLEWRPATGANCALD